MLSGTAADVAAEATRRVMQIRSVDRWVDPSTILMSACGEGVFYGRGKVVSGEGFIPMPLEALYCNVAEMAANTRWFPYEQEFDSKRGRGGNNGSGSASWGRLLLAGVTGAALMVAALWSMGIIAVGTHPGSDGNNADNRRQNAPIDVPRHALPSIDRRRP